MRKFLTFVLFLPFYLFSFESPLLEEAMIPDQVAFLKSDCFKKEDWRHGYVFFNGDESCINFISKKDPNLVLQLRYIDSFVFYDKDQDIYEDLLTHTTNHVFQNPKKDDLSYEILSHAKKDIYVKWTLKNPHQGFPPQYGYSRIHLTVAGVHVLSLISMDSAQDVESLIDPYNAFYEDVEFLELGEKKTGGLSLFSMEKDPIALPESFKEFFICAAQILIDKGYFLFLREYFEDKEAEASLQIFCLNNSQENSFDLQEEIDDVKKEILKAYKQKVTIDVENTENAAIIKYKGKSSEGFCILYYFEKENKIHGAKLYYTAEELDPVKVDAYLTSIKQIEFFN